MEYIGKLFKYYGVHVDGIITGTGRKGGNDKESKTRVEQLFTAKYAQTIHIDDASVVVSFRDNKEYRSYDIPADTTDWSGDALEILRKKVIHEA